MPAGNDAAAAAAELADRLAQGDARVEDLRTANRERFSHELRTALQMPRNDEATDDLDWSKAAKACGVDAEDVIDAAVRGDYVVVVYENDRGDSLKACGRAEDAGVEIRTVGKKAQRRRREAAERVIAQAEENANEKAQGPKKSGRKRSSKKRSSPKGTSTSSSSGGSGSKKED